MSSIQESSTTKEFHAIQKTVLVVEDDEAIAEMLIQAIEEETAHAVLHTADTKQALQMMNETKPDLLILNYHLPAITGIELYDKIANQWGNIPAIMISANLPQEEVTKRNVIGLHKPFELDELLDTIDRLLIA